MIRYVSQKQLPLEGFDTPPGMILDPNNRWIKLRDCIPVNGTQIILPGKALKKDTRYQKDKKRKQCRRRAAIKPIIGHLKSDYRMARNYLKGAIGDHINLLMAAAV